MSAAKRESVEQAIEKCRPAIRNMKAAKVDRLKSRHPRRQVVHLWGTKYPGGTYLANGSFRHLKRVASGLHVRVDTKTLRGCTFVIVGTDADMVNDGVPKCLIQKAREDRPQVDRKKVQPQYAMA